MTLLLPLLVCPMHFLWEGQSSRSWLIRMAEGELLWKIPSFWLVSSCNSMPLHASKPQVKSPVQSKLVRDLSGRTLKPPKQSSVWSFDHFSGPELQNLDTGRRARHCFHPPALWNSEAFSSFIQRAGRVGQYVFKGVLPAGPSPHAREWGWGAAKEYGEHLWRPVPQEARSPAEPAKDVNHPLNSCFSLNSNVLRYNLCTINTDFSGY